MNLLEQYIKEIHSEKPHEEEWTKEFKGKQFVEVEVTTNCYGSLTTEKRVFEVAEWAIIKEQGYWMG